MSSSLVTEGGALTTLGAVVTGGSILLIAIGFMMVHMWGRRGYSDFSDAFHLGLRSGKARARSSLEVARGNPRKAGGFFGDAMRYQSRFDHLLNSSYNNQATTAVIVFNKGRDAGYSRVKSSSY